MDILENTECAVCGVVTVVVRFPIKPWWQTDQPHLGDNEVHICRSCIVKSLPVIATSLIP